MKNIIKTSLIAATAIASLQSSSFAADTIADAFKDGTVKGQLKSYYFAKTYDSGSANKDASIWVNGAQLGYKTADFHGLALGLTSQFASVTSIDDPTGEYAGTMDAAGTVTSESYLQYTLNKTSAKIGRQFFWTPIVGGSGSRFIRQSFEGYSVTDETFDNTKIVAAYMTKFQARTDSAGSPGKFNDSTVGNDGTMTLYVKNNSVDGLTLQAQYAAKSEATDNSKNGWDIMYADATYKISNDLKPFVAAQYLATDYEDTTKDASAYGIKAGASMAGVSATIAYTSVGDSTVKQGIGSGSIPLYTNGAAVDAWSATFADTDSYKMTLGYTIDTVSLAAAYSNFDRKNQDTVTDTSITATYKPTKNLTAQVQYSLIDNQYAVEAGMDTDLRTRLIYSF
jgi:hypothetical protein